MAEAQIDLVPILRVTPVRLGWALLAIVLASFLPLPIYGTSFEPSGPVDGLVVRVWLIFAAGGFAAGALIPRHWYAALGVAWYPILFGLAAPFRNCVNPEPFEYYCVTTIHLFWISPVVALTSGYLGAKINRMLARW